jgi:hypothetical protein
VKHISSHIVLSLLLCVCADVTRGQVFGTTTHSVTVQVVPMTSMQVVGGGVSLNMNNATVVAGQDSMRVTNTSTSIRWATNSANRKITVATNLATSLCVLRIVAINPTQGTAAPEVTLGTTARDLLLNAGRSTGTASLRYTGVAYASRGTGTDTHVITFTVQAQ